MRKNSLKIATLSPYFCIPLLTILSHATLYKYGLALLNSDFATEPLVVKSMQQGHFSPFHFGQSYGGVLLTLFRAAWTAVIAALGVPPRPLLEATLQFSYLILPAVFSLLVFSLVKNYVSVRAAWAVGFLAALGIPFVVLQFGNDSYWGYLILVFLLLIWRSKHENPLLSLQNHQLVLAGVLSGLAVYTFRASLIHVALFWVPISWVGVEFKNLLRPKDRIEKFAITLGLFFVCLFLFLFVFGKDLGSFFGRPVKMHASPNLTLAAICFLFVWLKNHGKSSIAHHWKKLALACAGFLIGFSPEIYYWTTHHQISSALSSGKLVHFRESLSAISVLPNSWREWVSGNRLITREVLVGFTIFAIWCLFKNSRSNNFRAKVMFALLALTISAYCLIQTYTFAETRYLLPALPALMVALGFAFEQILKTKNSARYGLLTLILAIYAIDFSHARFTLIQSIKDSAKIETTFEVVKSFQEQNIKYVFTDSYWHTNAYTVVSDSNPIFLTIKPNGLVPWDPGDSASFLDNSNPVGLLITQPEAACSRNKLEIRNRKWSLKCLKSSSTFSLYVAAIEK